MMYDETAASVDESLNTLASRKGLDWLIDYAVTTMEGQHRRETMRLHHLVKRLGDALSEAHAALRHHPGGDTRGEEGQAFGQAAVDAYNEYRAD